MTNINKEDIIKKYRLSKNDTGSAEVQIALLSERIALLTEHLKVHRHDFHTRNGLMVMVGRRKRLLTYLKRRSEERYQKLIKSLGLRR